MKEITVVRLMNGFGCELNCAYCETTSEVRHVVACMLDTIEDGDTITFEVVLK